MSWNNRQARIDRQAVKKKTEEDEAVSVQSRFAYCLEAYLTEAGTMGPNHAIDQRMTLERGMSAAHRYRVLAPFWKGIEHYVDDFGFPCRPPEPRPPRRIVLRPVQPFNREDFTPPPPGAVLQALREACATP